MQLPLAHIKWNEIVEFQKLNKKMRVLITQKRQENMQILII